MDLIKGLQSGLFCFGVCGDYKHREAFAKKMKKYIDDGLFIRDIRNAPRDARYKIDYYLKDGVNTELDTIDYEYINFHENTLNFLGIDESFNPTDKIKNTGSFKCNNDFELCYGAQESPSFMGKKKNDIHTGYYFKYKGEPCRLMFSHSPKLVDYNDTYWAKYKGFVVVFSEFDKLIHNVTYYITYFNIKKV